MILCVDKLSKRGTELLCFSKTRELWSSIAFFAAVHHLSGNRTLLTRIRNILVPRATRLNLDHVAKKRRALGTRMGSKGLRSSGRKNVLRKLLRIPYRRLKVGFSVWLCLFVAGVLSEMHEVRTFAPCKALIFYLTSLLFFRRLKITLDSEQPMLKEKRIIPSVWGGIKGFEHFQRGEYFFWLCIRLIYELISPGWMKIRFILLLVVYYLRRTSFIFVFSQRTILLL